MDVKVGLELGLPSRQRRKLCSVNVVLTRVGFSLIFILIVVWWKGITLRQELRRFWLGTGESGNVVKGLSWGKISPSDDILWHHCFDKYDCARLQVPLDWLDPSPSHLVTIAIIRYNATDRVNYKGPIIINPGGPGGSGVWFVKHLAPYYQSVVGKNHDIISFDPRGVGATTPSISCWNTTTASSMSPLIWNIQEPPVLDAYPGVLYESYAHASAFSDQCAAIIGQGENAVGKFVSTPSVARDVLHIVEKLGEQKLSYWGFSYGTFLGVVFASLYPDKVERMVLDGNVDPEQFSSGEGTHYLTDTDAVMESFYTYCHQAGSSLCAFHASSPVAIETRLSTLLTGIKTHPVIVPASKLNSRPEIVTFSKVRKLIASALYRPLVVFPALAKSLAALESGDGRPFLDWSSQGQDELPMCNSDTSNPEPIPEIPEAEGSVDASNAILCSDQAPFEGGVNGFLAYLGECEQLSQNAGATMAGMRLDCVEWGVKAKWRYTGPFGSNVSAPLLLVGNTADNITPLRNAHQIVGFFPGSVALKQNSYGHTSLSMPSRCTAKTIRAYFQNGTLPAEGSVCEGDLVPFQPWNMTRTGKPSDAGVEEYSELDEALLALMKVPIFGT